MKEESIINLGAILLGVIEGIVTAYLLVYQCSSIAGEILKKYKI